MKGRHCWWPTQYPSHDLFLPNRILVWYRNPWVRMFHSTMCSLGRGFIWAKGSQVQFLRWKQLSQLLRSIAFLIVDDWNIDVIYFSDDVSMFSDQKWFHYRPKKLWLERRAFRCYAIERVVETTCHSKWDRVLERDLCLVMCGDGKLRQKQNTKLLEFIDLNLFTKSKGPAGWGFKLKNKRTEPLVFILLSLWDPYRTQDTFVSCAAGRAVLQLLN